MQETLDTLNMLAATSSRNEKIAILKERGRAAEFQMVANSALNPFITYGIRAFKRPESKGPPEASTYHIFSFLGELARRELTGTQAQSAVTGFLENCSPAAAEVICRILARDLKCGVDAKTINKVLPGRIPIFSCQLAEPYDPARVQSWPVVVQEKLDGVRVLVDVDAVTRKVSFFSRSGKEFTSFDHLVEPVLQAYDSAKEELTSDLWPRVMLDGEVTAGSFNDTVSSVRKKKVEATDAVLNLFDIIPIAVFKGEHSRTAPYKHRSFMVSFLDEVHPQIRVMDQTVANSDEEVMAIYARLRSEGREGVIVKSRDGQYHLKRTFDWMKIKDCVSADLKVVGVTAGTGKYEGKIGALQVDHKGFLVNVGSGLTDELRSEDPYSFIGRIIEVQYHEETPDGSLRHPRFVRFRDSLTGSKE